MQQSGSGICAPLPRATPVAHPLTAPTELSHSHKLSQSQKCHLSRVTVQLNLVRAKGTLTKLGVFFLYYYDNGKH